MDEVDENCSLAKSLGCLTRLGKDWGLDSAVFCTKRISIHLLASHTNGLSYSPACGSAIDSPLLGEDKTPVLPSPPQPLGVAEVATRLSSIHLDKLGREGPKEARELNSLPRTIG